jgi:hypothetical protein
MGAALTYARRYALFTLVGIAGEDDLDAPDLPGSQLNESTIEPSRPNEANGHAGAAPADQIRSSERGITRKPKVMRVPELPAGESAAIRDRLLAEVAGLSSADAAASWARDGIKAKNGLTATDAGLVEGAFAVRLAEMQSDDAGAAPAAEVDSADASAAKVPASLASVAPALTGIDKSVLTVAEPRRYRNKEHLRFVAKQSCLVCGRKHSDPHHLRFAQPRALGRKASDEFVVPLCRIHHRAVHRVTDEVEWWKRVGVDPLEVARQLWAQTRAKGGSKGEWPELGSVGRAQ